MNFFSSTSPNKTSKKLSSFAQQWILLYLGITLGIVIAQFYQSIQMTSNNHHNETRQQNSMPSSRETSSSSTTADIFLYPKRHPSTSRWTSYTSLQSSTPQKKRHSLLQLPPNQDPNHHHLVTHSNSHQPQPESQPQPKNPGLHSGRWDLVEDSHHQSHPKDDPQGNQDDKAFWEKAKLVLEKSSQKEETKKVGRETVGDGGLAAVLDHPVSRSESETEQPQPAESNHRSGKKSKEDVLLEAEKASKHDKKHSFPERGGKKDSPASAPIILEKKKHHDKSINEKDHHHDHHHHDEKKNDHSSSSSSSSSSVASAEYYLKDDKIVGDVRHLLDFAILGFSKTATTYLKDWFRQQTSHISMSSKEICYLNKKQGSNLIHHLVDTLDGTKLRGFKCPSHFTRPSLIWYRTLFPQTKLIVGLRHPVSWFESFYNFRIRHPKYPHNASITLPPPEQLIGKCSMESQGLCTDNAQFHRQLARMAKTPLNATERALLQLDRSDLRGLGTSKVENPVFVYEITQIRQNPTQFATDIAHFLELPQPLQPFVDKHGGGAAKKDGSLKRKGTVTTTNKKKTLSICEPKYDAIRQELMKISHEASDWILQYFLPHVTITTSPTSSFVRAIEAWKKDPCDTTTATTTSVKATTTGENAPEVSTTK